MARQGTQVTLDPQRYQAVAELAESLERPVSEVVREVFDLGLAQVKSRKQRKIKALTELNALRGKLEARMGTYPGDPVAEARAERERQTDAVLSRTSER